MQQLGCTQKELKPLILKSLEVDNPGSWAIGAVYALQFPDDELTALLAKNVKTPIKDKNVQVTIISALAANRTEDSVKALKELLKDSDSEIQKLTKQIIIANFNNLAHQAGGKSFKKEDFSEIIAQQDEILSGENVYGKNKSDMPLTLSIRALQDEIKLGDPIPIEFNITYHGKSTYSYRDRNYDRSGRMSEYILDAKDKSGKIRDPRIFHQGGIGGGLSGLGKLATGEFFKKVIDLNRWALIKKPGEYEINGYYAVEAQENKEGKAGYILSKPIKINILPRSGEELSALINSLGEQLKTAKDREKKDEIIQELMYTGDSRIIPYLLDDMYQLNPSYWTWEAFECYLSDDPLVKETLLKAAKEKGLVGEMDYILQRLGVAKEEMVSLIAQSLKSDNPNVLAQACALAPEYWDDNFTSRLVEIANTKEDDMTNLILIRTYAINALASNRSDESVDALKKLLRHPDPEVRKNVKQSIQTAYHYRGRWKGEPLKKEDFPGIYEYGASYQEDTKDIVMDDPKIINSPAIVQESAKPTDSPQKSSAPISSQNNLALQNNETAAVKILKTLATASETFYQYNKKYPLNMIDLTSTKPPYIDKNYCNMTTNGFLISCQMTEKSYTYTAVPLEVGITGATSFTMTTGGYLTPPHN